MVRTSIQAGVCGFRTTVTATSADMRNVTLGIVSDCEKIQKLAADLPVIDAYQEIGEGFDGTIHRSVRIHLRGCCSGCVVPSGIFKSVQVAGGVALPASASMTIEKLEEGGGA